MPRRRRGHLRRMGLEIVRRAASSGAASTNDVAGRRRAAAAALVPGIGATTAIIGRRGREHRVGWRPRDSTRALIPAGGLFVAVTLWLAIVAYAVFDIQGVLHF